MLLVEVLAGISRSPTEREGNIHTPGRGVLSTGIVGNRIGSRKAADEAEGKALMAGLCVFHNFPSNWL